jgi:hypothetical protein
MPAFPAMTYYMIELLVFGYWPRSSSRLHEQRLSSTDLTRFGLFLSTS